MKELRVKTKEGKDRRNNNSTFPDLGNDNSDAKDTAAKKAELIKFLVTGHFKQKNQGTEGRQAELRYETVKSPQ